MKTPNLINKELLLPLLARRGRNHLGTGKNPCVPVILPRLSLGHLEAVRSWLAREGLPNSKSEGVRTALYLACELLNERVGN